MEEINETPAQLEEDHKYNSLTAVKLFAMTSSMVISVNELAPFGKTGPTALFYLLLAGIIWFIPLTEAISPEILVIGINQIIPANNR